MEGGGAHPHPRNQRQGGGGGQQMQYVPVSGSKSSKKAEVDEETKQNNHANQEGSQASGKGKQQQYRPVHGSGGGQPGYMSMAGSGGYGGMMNQAMVIPPGVQLPSLMTPQQKQEQFQAIQTKLTVKSTLTELCENHPTLPIIFEKDDLSSSDTLSTKFCEKCFIEFLQSKESINKDENEEEKSQAASIMTSQSTQQPKQLTIEEKKARVQELQIKLQNLLSSLSIKMQRKVDDLNLRYQQLFLYEATLTEKFQPLFQIMRQTVREKELDYMTYLLKQLDQNKDRVFIEKVTLQKLMTSYSKFADDIKRNLEMQLKNIEACDKETEKLNKDQEVTQESPSENTEAPKVNTYQIDALSTMIDDYENIITKNYCVYTNYEDFSFAQTRSVEQLEQQFKDFVVSTFSGDYQMKNWFNQEVLPRINLLQYNTKFIYNYKILHNNSECQSINNTFPIPEKHRHIVTPDGHLYLTGGYQTILKIFLDNTFILDDHRTVLVPLQRMKKRRADHAVLYYKDHIYVFGGMALTQGSSTQVESLTSCEVYSIKDDQWLEMPPMGHARQSFSACLFNEKYIFVFGGKVLGDGATLRNMNDSQPFDFVSQVEVFEIEKNAWKVINYISENNKLKVLHPGTYQVTGKKIIIFGGVKPADEENNQNPAIESGKKVSLSNETLFFNVTNGEVKSGPEISKPSYYLSGGFVFPQQGKIHAFGFTNVRESMIPGLVGLAYEPTSIQHTLDINPTLNKKTLNVYKVAEEEWSNVHEAVFSGQRKMSMDTLDETF